jgi:hypothetical protein
LSRRFLALVAASIWASPFWAEHSFWAEPT